MKRFLIPVLFAVVVLAPASVVHIPSLGACTVIGPVEILVLQLDSVRVEGVRQSEVSLHDGFSVRVLGGSEETVVLSAQDQLSGLSYLGIYARK